MGIKQKSIGVVVLVSLLLFITSGMGLYGMGSIGQTLNQIENVERIAHLAESITNITASNYAQLQAAMQHDPEGGLAHMHEHPIGQHLDSITRGVDSVSRAVQELQNLNDLTPAIAAQLERFAAARNTFGAEALLPAKSALHAEMYDEASAFIPDLSVHYQAVSEEADKLVAVAREEIQALQNGAARRYEKLRTMVLVAVGVAISAMVWLGLRLMKAAQALSRLTQLSLRIADNDLMAEVPIIASGDELEQLSAAIGAIRQKLVERIREIAEVSQRVYSAVETMTAVAEHTRAGVERQRSETDQVATAMNEMTATVHEVARNTAAAANAASQADSEVSSGSQVVRDTIRSIERLADGVRKGAEVIGRLEDDSDNIGAVLDVIKGIAEQTNLLALNAAIEAARAGEQGRGFAVVADEVRTLAQRTQKSTQEIQQMIEKLQQGARAAVQVMEEGRSQAEASVAQATQAGRSLDSIHDAVSTIHDMSTQIASAAEEQSSVAEEINRNIVNISQIVDQSADGVVQTAEASEQLGRLAEQLQAVVQRFKLP